MKAFRLAVAVCFALLFSLPSFSGTRKNGGNCTPD